jgi:NADH:ubiquinone oxidoreductase subunit 2 (subunit N)
MIPGSAKTALVVCVIGILAVGILFAPWFDLAQKAVASIF